MQTVKTIGAILLGIVVFSFVYAKVDATAAVWLAVVAGALLLLRAKPWRNSTPIREPGTSSEEADFDSDDVSLPSASGRRQTLRDMDQHTYVIMANGRRSRERGQKLQAQAEVIDLTRKNRELEEEIVRLNKLVRDLNDALDDPFTDRPAAAQRIG